MPLTGFDELPISPQMRRRHGHKQKTENDHQQRRHEIGKDPGARAGNRLEREQRPHHRNDYDRIRSARTSSANRVRGDPSARLSRRAARAHLSSPRSARSQIVGSVRISVINPAAATAPAPIGTNVAGPQLVRRHLRDGNRRGIKRPGQILAEKTDRGHQARATKKRRRQKSCPPFSAR